MISNKTIPQDDPFLKLAKTLGKEKADSSKNADDRFLKLAKMNSSSVSIGAEDSPAARHNNPGNLIYLGQEGAKRGERRDDGTYWAEFDTPEAGYEATKKDIEIKKSGESETGITGDSPLRDFFAKYAPAHENDTDRYIANVAEGLGVSPDTPIKDIDTEALAKEVVKWESSTKVIEPEPVKLSFQKEQELKEFDDLSRKYTISDAARSAVKQAGLNPNLAERKIRNWEQPMPRSSEYYKMDMLKDKLNAFEKLFPEYAEDAKELREAMNRGNYIEVEEELKDLEFEVSGEGKTRGAHSLMGVGKEAYHENWWEYKKTVKDNPAYTATERLIENTEHVKNVLALEENKGGSMITRWARGVVGKEGLPKNLELFELPSIMKDNAYVTRLSKKINQTLSDGEDLDLTKEDERLLLALIENTETNMAYDPQRWTAYNWGAALGQNVGFIAEFMLTGGIRKAVQEGTERYVARNILGKSATTIQGLKSISGFEAGMAKLAGIGVQTIYMPSMYNNMAQKVSTGTPAGQAFMDAYYETFTEVFSENIFVGKINNLAANPGLYQKTLRQAGSALAGRKGVKGWLASFGEEFLEEKFNEGFMAGKSGSFDEWWSEFTSVKSNVFMAGSVASMTGIMGSPMLAADASSRIQNSLQLNALKKAVPEDMRSEIDIILDDKNVTVQEAYSAIFNQIDKKIKNNEIEGDTPTSVINALRYAVAKTKNKALEQFAGGIFEKRAGAMTFLGNLSLRNEVALAETLRKNGIKVPENNDVSGLLDNEALLKSEDMLTEEEKSFVDNFYASIEEFQSTRADEIQSERNKSEARARDRAELNVFLAEKEKVAVQTELDEIQKEIDTLEAKENKTEEDNKVLGALKDIKKEGREKIYDLETILKSENQKLTNLRSGVVETESDDTLKTEKSSPESETLQPKTRKDLEEVSRRIFGEKNEKKVKASAVVMDRLIGNMAKRAGVSKAEMYAKMDFTKISPEEMAEMMKDPATREKAQQSAGAFVTSRGRMIVYAITDPNVSTPMHEMAHAFEGFLDDSERKTILEFAGQTEWNEIVSEKYARGFEKYLAEGVAPSAELAKIFENFKNWLLDIYNGIVGSGIDIELNKEMRDIYDKMLAQESPKTEKDGKLRSERVLAVQEGVQKRETEKQGVSKSGDKTTEGSKEKAKEPGKAAEKKDKADEAEVEGLSPEAKVLFQSVWHGSPHEYNKEILVRDNKGNLKYLEGTKKDMPTVPPGYEVVGYFPYGRMRTDKIGTGEGEQAFGWGLYFTDKKDIAEGYAQKLTANKPAQSFDNFKYNGDIYTAETTRDDKKKKNNTRYLKNGEEISGKEYNDVYYNKSEKAKNRNLYEVKLHGDRSIDEFNYLRWDKPLTENQADRVIKQLEKEVLLDAFDNSNEITKRALQGVRGSGSIDNARRRVLHSGYGGAHIYKNYLTSILGSPKETSLFLLRAGIDGIKYPTEYTTRRRDFEIEQIPGSDKWSVKVNGRSTLSDGTAIPVFDSKQAAEDYVKSQEKFNYVIFDENIAEIEDHIRFQEAPKSKKLNEVIPDSGDKIVQSKKEHITKKLQPKLNTRIKSINEIFKAVPKNSKIVRYNDAWYSVTPAKGTVLGVSIRSLENKSSGTGGKLIADKGLKESIAEYAKDENNLSSKTAAKNTVVTEAVNQYKTMALEELNKFTEQRAEKPRKPDTEFSKEDTGETKPFEPKRKQREKLPTEKTKIEITSRDALLTRIRAEKSAVRSVLKAIQALKDTLNEANSKKFIRPGEYISIMRRLAGATSQEKLRDAYEYAEKIIDSAEYRDNLGTAKSFLNKIGKKKVRNKFGTAIPLVDALKGFNPDQLSIEELKYFNSIAARVNLKGTPDVRSLPELVSFIEAIKFEQREEAREAKEYTASQVQEEINELNKLIETDRELEQEGKKIITRADITGYQRKLNRIRRIVTTMMNDGKMTQKQFEDLSDMLGNIVETKYEGGTLADEIQEQKTRYFDQIVKVITQLEDKLNSVIEKMPMEMQKPLFRLLSITRKDLQDMSLADIESFDRFIFNLAEGFITPDGARLEITLGTNRLRSTVSSVFDNVRGAKQWNNYLKKHSGDTDFLSGLVRKFRMTKPHRMDTWLGNYDRNNTLGSLYNYMGRGVTMESATTKKFDLRLRQAHDNLKKRFPKKVNGKAVPGTVSSEEMKRVTRWIGFLLIEKTWRASPNYVEELANEDNASILHSNYMRNNNAILEDANNKKRFPEEVGLYKDFMDYLRENGATKEIGGAEVMDTEKAEDLLRETKEVADYIDTINEVVAETRGMAEWATYQNGRSFIPIDPYFPLISLKKGKMMEVDNLHDMINRGPMQPKMVAGATYERKGMVHYIETNPMLVMQQYIKGIARNYHVYGEVKKVMGAVADAGIEARQKDIESTEPSKYISNIATAILTDMRFRLDMHYRLNDFAVKRSGTQKILSKGFTALKKGLLATVHRIMPEFISNTIRATISTKNILIADAKALKQNKEIYSALIEDYIGERYMSRWGDEIKRDVWSNKTMKALEDSANWMITFSDTSVGRVLFVNAFRENFKKETGVDFDPVMYRDNFNYRMTYESAIERSATKGVRKVEELFNDKAPLTMPTLTSFLGGTVGASPTNFFTQMFDFLQSFNRNEYQQILDSVRRYKYSPDQADKALALRDIGAVVLSNAAYNTFRTIFGVWVNTLLSGATGGGDDPWTEDQKKSLKTWQFYRNEFLSATASIPMGGSSQIYLYLYKWGMYVVDNINYSDKNWADEKAAIKEFMSNEFYVRHIPAKGGSTRNVITTALPVPSAGTQDFFNALDDVAVLFSAIDENVTDEKKKFAIIELILFGTKYGAINPVTPTLQKMFNRAKNKARNGSDEEKSEWKDAEDAGWRIIEEDNAGWKDASEKLDFK